MVRPIDLQDVLSKTPLAEKVQQVRQREPDVQQRQLAQHLENRAAQSQERVEESEEGDQVTISGNPEGEDDLPKREGDREPASEEPEGEPDDGEHGVIDIRV
jgi:hypothetical protein